MRFEEWVSVEDDLPQIDRNANGRSVIVNVVLLDGSRGVGYIREDTNEWAVKKIKQFRRAREENPVAAWQSIRS